MKALGRIAVITTGAVLGLGLAISVLPDSALAQLFCDGSELSPYGEIAIAFGEAVDQAIKFVF